MNRHLRWVAVGALAFLASTPVQAEVRIGWERNERGAATAEFRFQKIPAPSTTDAATNARFRVVAGREDPNGGDVDTLHDGQLPGNEDQPDANFFFEAGTEGGRIVVDLGGLTEVKQVNTYSWHRSTRGPQVYRLYASAAADADLPAPPRAAADLRRPAAATQELVVPALAGSDRLKAALQTCARHARMIRTETPTSAGWRLLASVDTRPPAGELGGQYGVSIYDSSGGSLGTYRYLLFDISRTADTDRFGNTFFSEIDVSDGREHALEPRQAGEVEIAIDATEMPDLQPWLDAKLRPACEKWYPLIERMLASDGYTAPRRVSITFRPDMQGVAATSGTRISCAGRWFQRNLEGEAAGAVVHELVHVIQRYGRVRGGKPNPGWLVEGVADYIRWFHYEPESLRPRPDPARAKYTDSYRTTAAFLNYVVQTHDRDAVQKLNAAMRAGRYTEELWKRYTGMTVDELWAEYVKTLEKR